MGPFEKIKGTAYVKEEYDEPSWILEVVWKTIGVYFRLYKVHMTVKRSISEVLKEGDEIGKVVAAPEDYLEGHSDWFRIAIKHCLAVDPGLLPVIISKEFGLFSKQSSTKKMTLQDHFGKLGSSILGQQISNKAAKSIRDRFISYFESDDFPDYELVYKSLQDPEQRPLIKACGLSQRKVEYMESLSQYFSENEKTIEALFSKKDNDDEVVEELVKQIKGIGPWTAKMFLISSLKRPDVFAPEDLGIARGFSNYISDKPDIVKDLMSKRKTIKKSKIKHKKFNWKIYDDDIMTACADRFAPYRTLFMLILWRLASPTVQEALKNEDEFIQG